MVDKQRVRGEAILPKYVKLSYHTEVKTRALRVVRRGKAAAALGYQETESTPLFDDSTTAERWESLGTRRFLTCQASRPVMRCVWFQNTSDGPAIAFPAPDLLRRLGQSSSPAAASR